MIITFYLIFVYLFFHSFKHVCKCFANVKVPVLLSFFAVLFFLILVKSLLRKSNKILDEKESEDKHFR